MKLEITRTKTSDHAEPMEAAEALAEIRKEWQSLAEGQSLVVVEASIGLLLLDVAEHLRFTTQERLVLLGSDLERELQAFANLPIGS